MKSVESRVSHVVRIIILSLFLACSAPFINFSEAAGQRSTSEPQPSKKPACPQCRKSSHVIPIVYGLPGKALMDESAQGKVKLGGCIVSDQNPQWHCKSCDKDW